MVTIFVTFLHALRAQAPCANPVACENTLVGNLSSEWDVAGSGDPTIQGFATDISVNRGTSVTFKISTTASAYRIDIYRLGYYAGRGARKVASISPSAVQNQPSCLGDSATGLIDCGNWSVSASWSVPATAISGVYIARPVRLDTGGASHIPFIVRDDGRRSDVLFQTSDTTWQAYNTYGGNSLYVGNPIGRAYKVSYNRPFANRDALVSGQAQSYVFSSEYPMIRWLEANGYDLSYASAVDTDRRGSAPLLLHKAFFSVGHDEYWSAAQRANVEAARAAGIHLGFFSGNEIFWKTRWENSIAGSPTAYRTLVCYKETSAGAKTDPSSVWTGTWRDARFSPPSDGGRPENALTGQLFTVNGYRSDPIAISAAEGKLRFWRNCGIDSLVEGSFVQLPKGILGYEWDETLDNGFRPPGLFRLSTTTLAVATYVQDDFGANYGPGVGSHSLSLYRHSSGALVFGAGTTQWSWGLDANHDLIGPAPDWRMQQATVNLLADMGVGATTLQSGLTPATASSDTTPPTSVISLPSNVTIPAWSSLSIFGSSTDGGGGRPAGIEISFDSGSTWRPIDGASKWSATWTAGGPGVTTIKSRAIDDSGRVETPGPGVSVTVTGNSTRRTLWPPEATPTVQDNGSVESVELGVRFQSSRDGWITGLRFYKSEANTGLHVGHLWSSDGLLLGIAAFTNETSSGWQEAPLAVPVQVVAGRSYIASYHTDQGHYARDPFYFEGPGVVTDPLSASATLTQPNGLYTYTPGSFPTETSQSSNYWVDVVFSLSSASDTTPPLVAAISPSDGASGWRAPTEIALRFSEAMSPLSISATSVTLRDPQGALVPSLVTYDIGEQTAKLQPLTIPSALGSYTITVKSGSLGASDLAGNKLPRDFNSAFSVVSAPTASKFSLWPSTAVPVVADQNDVVPLPVELGVRFQSAVDGWITALRFYKSPANTVPHVGNLWASDGTLLGSALFDNETASGWQETQLAEPVFVTAGSTYIASYYSEATHYSRDPFYFANHSVNSPPLSAPADISGAPNGVYHYGGSAMPKDSGQSANYWVDVVMTVPPGQTAPPSFTPPGGTYSSGQTIAFSNTTPGAQMFYTTNGSTPTATSTRYTAPIPVSSTTTLKAIAIASGLSNSPITTATYTIQSSQVAAPSMNPPAGSYSTGQSVAISVSNPGAVIYYTTNGATPTTASAKYTAPISVSNPTTIKAIATVTGLPTSPVTTATYSFQAAPPSFNPGGGTYAITPTVTISDSSPGAAIYYTINGTTPTTSSPRYTAPLTLGSTTTINAIAAVSGWSNSGVSSATYTIQLPSRPAAPGNLSANAASVSQINLAWTDLATNETGYKIERKTGTTGTYAQIATVGANVTTYSDTTVSSATTYVYRIRSTNGGGDSSYSNEASATTPSPGAPPAPWTQADIGGPGVVGAGTYAAGTFNVKGGGADIWNLSDAFHFVYQPLNGNGEIVARVASIQNTDPWAKAGVMIRETTAGGSRNAFMAITPSNGLAFQRRLATGGTSTSTSGAVVTAPYWVRLVRNGNVFTGYASTNGSNWTQVGTDTVAMGTTVQVGLAVSSHNNSVSCTAVLDNVTVTTPLGAPSSLGAVAASSTQVNLAWTDNATNETGFKIERKTGANGTYSQIATTGVNIAAYSDTGLVSGTAYLYRVRATNAAGDSAYSNEASVTTPVPPPATPTALTASTISSSQINLSWADVANETSFKIERKTGASGNYVQIGTTGAGVVTYNDSGLAVNTTYFYRVRATNSGGDSAYSAEANATTLNTAPAAPSSLTATAASTTQVNLSWVDNSPNETGFRIERSIGSSFVEITTVGAGVTFFNDTGLVPGTNYLYRVRATNALGDSAYSNQASATTLVPPPSAPAGLTATAASSSQINLTWTDVANETGFKIERKTGAGGSYAQVATVAAGVTSYSNTGLAGGTTYFYRIRATNSGGDSAYSSEANATTLLGAPAAPATLSAVAVSSNQINLTWADVSNETGFKIERKTGATGTYSQIATTTAGVLTYNNTGLTPGTAYYYRVRATNAAGDSPYSPEASAIPSVPTFRSASSAGATSGVQSLVIGKPAGTVQGDVMVAAVAIRPSNATITASGWTLVRRLNNSSGNPNSLAVYYKVASSSEPSSYTFTLTASNGAAGGIRSYSGVDNANPIDVEAGQNTPSALTHTAPSVTTRFPYDMIVTSHSFSTSATFTPPAGMTEAFDVRSDSIGSSGESMEGNHLLQAAVGASGARTATASNDADVGNAHALALKAR